jgi:ABC-type antimicrobial peptide transport system permease subunit
VGVNPAFAIGGFGLYSLLSYLMVSRIHEIGIRRALGASSWQIVYCILREGLTIGVSGAILGASLSLFGARVFGAAVAQFGRIDVRAFLFAGIALLVVVALSSLLPAVRAVRVDPAIALRHS